MVTFLQLPQDIWTTILDYITQEETGYKLFDFDVKNRIAGILIGKTLMNLTHYHYDMVDGWDKIISNYWKHKRLMIKTHPEYQLAKFMNTSFCMLHPKCNECGLSSFIVPASRKCGGECICKY